MDWRWTDGVAARQTRRVLEPIATLAALLAAGPAPAATVTGIATAANGITVRFDERMDAASARVLASGARIALDVTGLDPGAAAAALAVRASVAGPALVSRVREAARARRDGEAVTRLTFDLLQPATIGSGRFDADGRVLTLSLHPATREAAASALTSVDFFPFSFGTRRAAVPGTRVSLPVPPAPRTVKLPPVEGDRSRPLVVIDPGHGGFDPGAISPGTGLREKDVTLRIAKAMRDELLASGRVRVALTRSDDRYLVLRERFGIARRLHADLFVSVHCDSTGSEDATGASVYTLSEVASDKEAARLAARENKADVIAGVNLDAENADVSSILIDLAQRETMNSSASFARLLGREAAPLMPLKPNFHRMASLMVLKAPDMPSILFETGYISNPRDAAFLDSREGRDKIAESLSRAVQIHFARRLAMR